MFVRRMKNGTANNLAAVDTLAPLAALPFLSSHPRRGSSKTRRVSLSAVTRLLSLLVSNPPPRPCQGYPQPWTPNVNLVDTSDAFPADKPDPGWHVTPAHATLLHDGRVLIGGWARRDFDACAEPDGTRRHALSFVLDAEEVVRAGYAPPPEERGQSVALYSVPRPLDEKRKATADTLHASGRITLPDGKVFVVGGATYRNLGSVDAETERGLNQARLFDPVTNEFSVASSAPIGMFGHLFAWVKVITTGVSETNRTFYDFSLFLTFCILFSSVLPFRQKNPLKLFILSPYIS